MSDGATGHVRVINRANGPVLYAAIRLEDGRRLQRKLGRAWLSRSRPPAGYITRREAEARLEAILAGRDGSIDIQPPPEAVVTFGMAAENWFKYVRDDRKRRESTVRGYRRELDKNLIPEFGADTPLDSITTEQIDAYRERLVEEDRLSPRTINKRLAQLHAIFKRAQKAYGLPLNPAAGAERQPHNRSGDIQVLEPGEVELLANAALIEPEWVKEYGEEKQIREAATRKQDAAFFRVAAFTGLRLGEMRALRWSDIDWTRRLVHVRRSYTWGGEGPPKSGKVRSVPLSDQAAQAFESLSRRDFWTGDDDLIFVSPTGNHVEESALRRRFYKALDNAGLPRMRIHDLRHTFGTLGVQVMPLTDVKAYMGHQDIQTTMIYVHHVPQHDAADKLTKLLQGGAPNEVRRTLDARNKEDQDGEVTEPLEQAENQYRGRDLNPRHADYDGAE